MANRVYGYQGYKGYQFETSPKKLQPEYETDSDEFEDEKNKVQKKKNNKKINEKNKEQVKQKNNAQKKISVEEFNRKAKLVCYILFGFSVLFTISYRNSIINEKFNEKENLKAVLADIQKSNEQIEVSIENELNLTSVEQLAKEKLGMSKLNNSQKIYINLPKREYVESTAEGVASVQNQNAYQGFIEKIKHFFNIN